MKKLACLILIICIIPISTAVARENPAIKVAVIDSGIDENNKLLDYSKITKGKSYIEGITSYADKVGHGTAVAGIIQSHATNANLVPLMYYSKYPSGVPLNGGIDAICRAIYDAVDTYQCKIINISSGIYTENDELKTAVAYAESKNVIVISAVGNDNITASDRVFYPAAYSTVIGVGAIDDNSEIADFSQRNESVMTVTYGTNIDAISVKNNSDYTVVSGTSYAAAALCGIAANAVEEYHSITPAEFRKLIRCSCIDLGEQGYDVIYGYGAIDEHSLLKNIQLLKGGDLLVFDDVNPDDYYFEAVKFMYKNVLMKGMDEKNFAPNTDLTPAMLVTILYRLEGETIDAAQKSPAFDDATGAKWYTDEIAWAVENGIIKDVGENLFEHGKNITREQLAVMIYNYANLKGIDVSAGEDTSILSYDDFTEISQYAIPSIQWAVGAGLIGSENNKLEPQSNVTRAEVSTILMRFIESNNK